MKPSLLLFTGFVATTGMGCVSTGKYDAAVADTARARDELARSRAHAAAETASKDAAARALAQRLDEAEGNHARAKAEADTCAKSLDEATAMNQELRKELVRLGKDVDALLSARGALAGSLEEARKRLDELRRAQAAAEARAALFRDLALRLKRMTDAGVLAITLRSGRMVLVMPTDVLFDSGKAKLKDQGRETLTAVGGVLAGLPDRKFQVAGHTDDEPIRVSGYASNWELSAQRALEVVHLLVESGMRPSNLSAAGYGEFDGVGPNDTRDGKARNRRIEITLQPQIDEMIAVP